MQKLTAVLLLLVLTVPGLAATEDVTELSPKQAYEAMQREIAAARQARNMARARAIQDTSPAEFLDAWDAEDREPTVEDLYYLAQIAFLAKRYPEAMDWFRASADLTEQMRLNAMTMYGNSAYRQIIAGELEGGAAEEAMSRMAKYIETLEGEQYGAGRASLHQNLARCKSHLGDKESAIGHYLEAAHDSPRYAVSSSRSVMAELMDGVHDIEAYESLRVRGEKLAAELRAIQKIYVEELREKGDERQVARAESYLERMENMTQPLKMLGSPPPEWTLMKAWGDTRAISDHRGKVVVVDFWATWCGWCIKSFPALRDLLRHYAGEDLVLVGATAPAGTVYESNYNLDEDLKAKAGEDYKLVPHRMPKDATEEQIAAFREEEKEVITTFIKNHEMSWDVVMIDPADPAAKYALTGWPHAMVLDRLGRVRYFKRGALLRDKPEQVEKFKDLLDALLAEDAWTHTLEVNAPFYEDGPQQGRPPDGEVLAGVKVKVLKDAGSYVLVETEDGRKGYVSADSVKPIK